MNTNEITDHDINETTDTEGHAARSGRGARASRTAPTDDTEGHMPYRIKVEDAGEGDLVGDTDTEGHRRYGRAVTADEGDLAGDADTEGHIGRFHP